MIWTLACAGLFALAGCGGNDDGAQASQLVQPPAVENAKLSVNMVGSGTVSSLPTKIDCGGTCAADFVVGTHVTLHAEPAARFAFSGWDGAVGDVDCSGTGDCTVLMDHAKSLKATFSGVAATRYDLAVAVVGSGAVQADVAGLSCSAGGCAGSFEAGVTVTLTATAASGYQFSGWSGSGISCAGTGSCQVPMSAARSVTATFSAVAVQTHVLTAQLAGSGSIGSTPAGISCGTDCTEAYAAGTKVTLAAVPGAGQVFSGWSGACTGTNGCELTMSAARAVTANFAAAPPSSYAVNTVVTGSGTLVSAPAGINCPTTCSASLSAGTALVLTATPASGQRVSGWTGACASAGTGGTCSVTVNANTSAGVTFVAITQALSVTTQGSGTVTSTPSGISCGATCSATYAQGTAVSLVAAPLPGNTFTNWTGACTGTATTCSVTLSAARSVVAVFAADTSSGGGAYNCADANVRCVSATAGATQEYSTIQAASSAAKAGDVVWVQAGTYTGFTASTSGTASAPIRFVANGQVIINQGSSSESDGIRLQNVSYVTIEGFTVRNDGGTTTKVARGISARGATADKPMRGNVLRNNTITSSGGEGVYISQFADGLVEGNTISGSGTNGEGRMHGIYLANAGSTNTTIRGNKIFDNKNTESNGIHANGDLSVGGNGLITKAVIEGNTIYGNGQNGINFDGVQDSLIQNNLIYGNARHALRDYMIDGAAGAARLRIVNNTLVASGGWAVKLSEDAGGHVIFNNILIGSAGSLSVGSTSLSSDANVLGGSLSTDSEATTVSLADWRSRTAQDAKSLAGTTTSVFVNAASANYALATSSPARDKGVSSLAGIAAPLKDLLGLSHLLGTGIDIGAIESAP